MAGPMPLSGKIFPQAHVQEQASRCARQGFADPLHLTRLPVKVGLIDEQRRVERCQHQRDRRTRRSRPDNGDVGSRFEAGRQVEPSAIGGKRQPTHLVDAGQISLRPRGFSWIDAREQPRVFGKILHFDQRRKLMV